MNGLEVKAAVKEALREEGERLAQEAQEAYEKFHSEQAAEPPKGFIRPVRGKSVDLCIDMIGGRQYQRNGAALSYTFEIIAGKEWLTVYEQGELVQLIDAKEVLSISGPQWIKGGGR